MRRTLRISPGLMALVACAYYGFSLYVDVLFYDVTQIPIFLIAADDYFPSDVYAYVWMSVTAFAVLNYVLLDTPRYSIQKTFEKNMAPSIFIGYGVLIFLLIYVFPEAQNRADFFRLINENFRIISWLLPISIWWAAFTIIESSRPLPLFFSVFLIFGFSILLVDRSYLLMGVLALLMRKGDIDWLRLIFLVLIFFLIFTFWKIALFWLMFDVDFQASLSNLQFGIARFEAITSQSIFVNCVEHNMCSDIDFWDFLSYSAGRIFPSFIYESTADPVYSRYIYEFFPEIAERGGGLGYSLMAEFVQVFGVLSAPFVLGSYIAVLLLAGRGIKNKAMAFILVYYFFRFLRVDFGTGVKGVLVYGVVSYLLFIMLSWLADLWRRRVGGFGDSKAAA